MDHRWLAAADVMTESIAADVAAQLEAGREVAYMALSSTDAFAASRVAGDEESVEGSNLLITEDGLVAGNFVATEDAVVAERLEANDQGVTYAIGLAVAEEAAGVEAEAGAEAESEEQKEDA